MTMPGVGEVFVFTTPDGRRGSALVTAVEDDGRLVCECGDGETYTVRLRPETGPDAGGESK